MGEKEKRESRKAGYKFQSKRAFDNFIFFLHPRTEPSHVEPLEGEMGVIGHGPNAITWVKPSYLDRAAVEHQKEYDELKEKYGEGNFLYEVDPKRIANKTRKQIIAPRPRQEQSDADSDVYSLVRVNWKDKDYIHPGRVGKPEYKRENAGDKK